MNTKGAKMKNVVNACGEIDRKATKTTTITMPTDTEGTATTREVIVVTNVGIGAKKEVLGANDTNIVATKVIVMTSSRDIQGIVASTKIRASTTVRKKVESLGEPMVIDDEDGDNAGKSSENSGEY